MKICHCLLILTLLATPLSLQASAPTNLHSESINASPAATTATWGMTVLIARAQPLTPVTKVPSPRIVYKKQTAIKPGKVFVRASATGCVRYLLIKGYWVPPNPRIAAKTLPVVSKALPPEGKVVVIVTAESKNGHVRAAKNIGGTLINVDDSVNGTKAVPIPHSSYIGYLSGNNTSQNTVLNKI